MTCEFCDNSTPTYCNNCMPKLNQKNQDFEKIAKKALDKNRDVIDALDKFDGGEKTIEKNIKKLESKLNQKNQEKQEGLWCDFCGKFHTGRCEKQADQKNQEEWESPAYLQREFKLGYVHAIKLKKFLSQEREKWEKEVVYLDITKKREENIKSEAKKEILEWAEKNKCGFTNGKTYILTDDLIKFIKSQC